MICTYCGNQNARGAATCAYCGMPLTQKSAPAYPGTPSGSQMQQSYPGGYAAPSQQSLPEEYRPLSPWAYFGYQLLFAIPLVGFIMLIVLSCGGTSNVNLKNFARSYWCAILVSVLISAVIVALAFAFGLNI